MRRLSQGIPLRPPGDRDAARVWWPILNLIILTRRPAAKGRDYASIWNQERDEGPLKTITRAQGRKARAPRSRDLGPARLEVDWAMRYGLPRIAERLAALQAQGLRPHPARAALSAILRRDDGDGLRQGVRGVAGDALAADPAGRRALLRRPRLYRGAGALDRSAASPSSISSRRSCSPRFTAFRSAYFDKGDPYYCHCAKTARLLARGARLSEEQFAHDLPVALRARANGCSPIPPRR